MSELYYESLVPGPKLDDGSPPLPPALDEDDGGGDDEESYTLEVHFHDVTDSSDTRMWAVWSAVFAALREGDCAATVYIVDGEGNTIRESDYM